MRIMKALLSALWIVSLLSSLSYGETPDRISGTIDPTNMVALTGHVTPMAAPQFDQGPVEPSRALHISMLFLPTAAQQKALVKLLADQQNPKSASYHKWFTADQYGEQFGLSQGDLQKITGWLEGQGFKVTYVAHGHDSVSFDGNAAQVESVFKTTIHNFNVSGKMHFANATPPMIPAVLAGIVGDFRGLHDFFPRPMHRPAPQYTLSSGGGTYHFLAPGDIAKIYDFNPLYGLSPVITGSGQNIVIAGQSDVYLADLTNFRTAFTLPSMSGCNTDGSGIIRAGACSSGNFTMVVPGTGSDPGLSSGDLGESDLDIETVNGLAPAAKIVFVTSSQGVDDSASWAIDQVPPLGTVINYSYGLCEALVGPGRIGTAEAVYQKAAGEGISFFAAAGDSGAAICDGSFGNYPAQLGLSVSYPASSQYVTGVGGTEFNEGTGSYWSNTNGSTGGSATGYIPEIAWNDSAAQGQLDATGGGPSNCVSGTGSTTVEGGYSFELCSPPPNGGFPKPSWQSGITPNDSVRDVPDIAFSASNANDVYIVCVPESELFNTTVSTSTCAPPGGINAALTSFPIPSAFGGTSAATPVAASMTALLNQYLGSSGVGNINQQLYTLYKNNPPPGGPFHDVTTGSNSVTGGTSNNIVACTQNTPAFEPPALQCTGSTFGYEAGSGYDLVTGLGSLDVYAFAQTWAASEITFATHATALSPVSIAAGNSTTSTVTIAPGSNSASQNATYTFTCSGLPTGATCTFVPSSVSSANSFTSQLTITTLANMATGTNAVAVTGTSGGVSEPANVSLTVTATTQSFTLSSNATGTLTVTPGQTTNAVTLSITGTNGFVVTSGSSSSTALPLTYTCSGLPSESQCGFSPGGSGGTDTTHATSLTLTIATTAPTGSLRFPFERGERIFYALLMPGLLGVVFTLGSGRLASSKRSLRGMRLLGLIVVLGCSTLWLGACGGSSNSSNSNPGTPAGTYTVTVNATTGGANPIANSTTLSLTVQ
jgi:hypothetical protein